jgi:putative flippase GtrA
MSFLGHKLFVFRTKGNFLKEYLRSFVVYGGTSLAGIVLLPIVMAVLNALIGSQPAVPYLAGGVLAAGTVVVSFFGHQRFTFALTTSESAPQNVRRSPDNGSLNASYREYRKDRRD